MEALCAGAIVELDLYISACPALLRTWVLVRLWQQSWVQLAQLLWAPWHGLLIAGVVLGALLAAEKLPRRYRKASDWRARHQHLKTVMEKLANDRRVIADELIEFRDLFNDVFVTPIVQALPALLHEDCLICHQSFPIDGERSGESSDDRPVRAPGCRGALFIHAKCNREWLQMSGDARCVTCGQ